MKTKPRKRINIMDKEPGTWLSICSTDQLRSFMPSLIRLTSRGNVFLQTGRVLFNSDLKKCKEKVLSYEF